MKFLEGIINSFINKMERGIVNKLDYPYNANHNCAKDQMKKKYERLIHNIISKFKALKLHSS